MRALCLLAVSAGCGSHPPPADAGCTPSILYLNRNGGMYDHGTFDSPARNQSVLLDGPRTLPAWPRDQQEWDLMTACIRSGLAPFAVTVTEQEPQTPLYVEIVFTTAYWGQPAAETMVVPASCLPEHALEFVFSDSLPPTYSRPCQMALIGYAEMTADLSPGDDCKDILNLGMDCVPERMFLDEMATCVDDFGQPTACRCGGTTENPYQTLAAAHPACP
ncbi:MAG: hypothetical protein JO257_25105 [Deltaproteobacteria bacterium]|nr:hypothetical protein [Deltaproteobacteria bacterium]